MNGFIFKVLAFFVFAIASSTDFLDGFFAKRRNEITDFGKIMDPVADKILVLSAFLAFVEIQTPVRYTSCKMQIRYHEHHSVTRRPFDGKGRR